MYNVSYCSDSEPQKVTLEHGDHEGDQNEATCEESSAVEMVAKGGTTAEENAM